MTVTENETEIVRMSKREAIIRAGVGGVIAERHGDGTQFQHYEIVSFNEENPTHRCVDMKTVDTEEVWSTSLIGGSSDDADRWHVVEKASEPIQYTSIFDFFASDSVYSGYYVVKADRSNWPHIFFGTHVIDWGTMEYAILLWDIRNASTTIIRADEYLNVNRWRTIELDDSAHTSTDHLNFLNYLANAEVALICNNEREIKLRGELETLQSDFKTVNEKINEYAAENHMCSDYERRIYGWNEELTTKLVGRIRNWVFPVIIPKISANEHDSYQVIVKARSLEEAKAEFERMSPNEVLKNLVDQGYNFGIHEGIKLRDGATPFLN